LLPPYLDAFLNFCHNQTYEAMDLQAADGNKKARSQ